MVVGGLPVCCWSAKGVRVGSAALPSLVLAPVIQCAVQFACFRFMDGLGTLREPISLRIDLSRRAGDEEGRVDGWMLGRMCGPG